MKVKNDHLVNFQFKQWERGLKKKFRASTGFKPVTSVIPVRCSTNWAMKPHIGSEVNLLSSFLPWGVKWCEVYMKYFIFELRGVDEREEWSWNEDWTIFIDSFLSYFFVKKYPLVGASGMLWAGGSVDQWEMYVCHTNHIGNTIKHQSNFLL